MQVKTTKFCPVLCVHANAYNTCNLKWSGTLSFASGIPAFTGKNLHTSKLEQFHHLFQRAKGSYLGSSLTVTTIPWFPNSRGGDDRYVHPCLPGLQPPLDPHPSLHPSFVAPPHLRKTSQPWCYVVNCCRQIIYFLNSGRNKQHRSYSLLQHDSLLFLDTDLRCSRPVAPHMDLSLHLLFKKRWKWVHLSSCQNTPFEVHP